METVMPALNIAQSDLDAYIAKAKQDYADWMLRPTQKGSDEHIQAMIAEFDITYEVGSTYIKVIESRNGQSRSVHSFIVNKAGKKFPVGTILKAASWKAPATNFGRGNIADVASYKNRLQWTGIL
jgi:hypothetical protein